MPCANLEACRAVPQTARRRRALPRTNKGNAVKSLALPLLALKIALIALVALAISVGDDPAGAAEKPSLQVGNVKLTVGMSKADVMKALGNVYALVEIGSHGANLGDYALVAAKGTTREDFFENPLKTTNEASLWFGPCRAN